MCNDRILKMKYVILILWYLLLSNYVSTAQTGVRVAVHPRETANITANTSYKSARQALYKNALEDIKIAKEEIRNATLQIERIQNTIYKSLTTVNTSIKEAKQIKLIASDIQEIYRGLNVAYGIAFDYWEDTIVTVRHYDLQGGYVDLSQPSKKYPLVTVHYQFNQLLVQRVIKLYTYLTDFVTQTETREDMLTMDINTGKTIVLEQTKILMSNAIRGRLMSNVAKEIRLIRHVVQSYIWALQSRTWLSELLRISVLDDYINNDIQKMNEVIYDIRRFGI